ncbi:hypothetical protein Tco_0874358 [Tanacetum coccineum]|uniref:Uncharacterized protein n=1 Tax=Tanacetum coccineum TaxID=301880 RepID=A0ABQ5BP85_9ASTR
MFHGSITSVFGIAKITIWKVLIYNSIMNGPYVRRMIPEPGDTDREVPVPATFHEQTDDELTVAEIKQMEADDQAIQTILLGLPEDIYAAVDSCETAQEIWLRVQQMMKGSDIGIQEKKAKLFNEWERNGVDMLPLFHQTMTLCIQQITLELYDLLEYKSKEVDIKELNRLAKTHDAASSSLQIPTILQHTVFSPRSTITKPSQIRQPQLNMHSALMAKAFKLNYSTPTNNNQRISSNPRNRQIAQPGMNMGQDNDADEYTEWKCVAARAEVNAPGNNGNTYKVFTTAEDWSSCTELYSQTREGMLAYLSDSVVELLNKERSQEIQLQLKSFDLMAAASSS